MKTKKIVIEVTAADVFGKGDRDILCYILEQVYESEPIREELAKRYKRSQAGVSVMLGKLYAALKDEEEEDEHKAESTGA